MDRDRITIRLLRGELSEMAELQRVIEEAPAYAQLVTGVPAGPADAQSTYTILPEGKSYEDKFVFGIFLGSEMVGCVDLIRGYPTPNTAYLGLLLVSEKRQRQGIGRVAYHLVEEVIRVGELRSNSSGSGSDERAGHSLLATTRFQTDGRNQALPLRVHNIRKCSA